MPQGPLDRLREFVRYQTPTGAQTPVAGPLAFFGEFFAERLYYFLVGADEFNLRHQFNLSKRHYLAIAFADTDANHWRLTDAPWPLLPLGEKQRRTVDIHGRAHLAQHLFVPVPNPLNRRNIRPGCVPPD